MSSVTKGRKKLIIDTDPGLDDTQAIMMALSDPSTEVIAFTTVSGNVGVEQVTKNLLKVLTVCDRLDIPVYKGATHSILGFCDESSWYHGKDGFGDVTDDIPVDMSLVKSEHAAQALVNLVNKMPGEISLVTLGPLTNVALAIRLDPTFGSKLKDCFMMGGNIEGRGNVTTSAEFNFHADPEAAFVALKELNCEITIAPWELCLNNALTWEWYHEKRAVDTPKAAFLRERERRMVTFCAKENWPTYIPCDEIAVALMLNEGVCVKKERHHATVELAGKFTRGQMVLDRDGYLKSTKKVTFVTQINESIYHKMLCQAVR